MVAFCEICKISTSSCEGKQLRILRFPRDSALRRGWAAFAQIPLGDLRKNSGLCTRHFKKEDLDDHKLAVTIKKGTLPTLQGPKTEISQLALFKSVSVGPVTEQELKMAVGAISSDSQMLEEGMLPIQHVQAENPNLQFTDVEMEEYSLPKNKAVDLEDEAHTSAFPTSEWNMSLSEYFSESSFLDSNGDVLAGKEDSGGGMPSEVESVTFMSHTVSGEVTEDQSGISSDGAAAMAHDKATSRKRKRQTSFRDRGVTAFLRDSDPNSLSDRERGLYHKIKLQESKLQDLERQVVDLNLASARGREFLGSCQLEDLRGKFSNACFQLLASQVKNYSKFPQSRRWDPEVIAMALSIYRKGRACYRYLETIMALPSVRTLLRASARVPFNPGLNSAVFSHLKNKVKHFGPAQRLCSLVFDEVHIKPGIHFDASEDILIGFEDMGGGKRSRRLANSALVFLVRGIMENWKMPVAYYFVKGPSNSQLLADLIPQVIKALRDIGLKVRAVICDQAGPNLRSLDLLSIKSFRTSNLPWFLVDEEGQVVDWLGVRRSEHEDGCKQNDCSVCEAERDRREVWKRSMMVVCIADPPHLIKTTRNNLANHKINFVGKDGTQKSADWVHLQHLYEQTKDSPSLVLTKGHLEFGHRKKMKVKLAAQTLSERVAKELMLAVGRKDLPEEALHLSELILDVDQGFDSLNGFRHGLGPNSRKLLRGYLKEGSPHLQVWEELSQKFASWKFVPRHSHGDGRPVPPPRNSVVKSWTRNISSMKMLWKLLQDEQICGLQVNLRNLNQDPIENLFGLVRARGGDNRVSLTCHQFKFQLKAVIVSGMVDTKNSQGNCEADHCRQLADFVHFLSASGTHADEENAASTSAEQAVSSSEVSPPQLENASSLQRCVSFPSEGHSASTDHETDVHFPSTEGRCTPDESRIFCDPTEVIEHCTVWVQGALTPSAASEMIGQFFRSTEFLKTCTPCLHSLAQCPHHRDLQTCASCKYGCVPKDSLVERVQRMSATLWTALAEQPYLLVSKSAEASINDSGFGDLGCNDSHHQHRVTALFLSFWLRRAVSLFCQRVNSYIPDFAPNAHQPQNH